MSEEIDYSVLYQPKKAVYVIKKDGSKEAFNVQKVIIAVGKSAYRALTKFTDAEKQQICQDVIDKVNEMESERIPIPVMHNIVESALEDVKPIVAKSYRDYRNYKQDFVRMMDDVYKKSQSIMYVGDKDNITMTVDEINNFNKRIKEKMDIDGIYFLHQFSINDDNKKISENAILYPLRYMSGNDNITKDNINSMIMYIDNIIKNLNK